MMFVSNFLLSGTYLCFNTFLYIAKRLLKEFFVFIFMILSQDLDHYFYKNEIFLLRMIYPMQIKNDEVFYLHSCSVFNIFKIGQLFLFLLKKSFTTFCGITNREE